MPVNFEVPPEIAAKIAAGALRLFGGMVRDLEGHIVMHLKEAGRPEAEEVAKKAVAVARRLSAAIANQPARDYCRRAVPELTLAPEHRIEPMRKRSVAERAVLR